MAVRVHFHLLKPIPRSIRRQRNRRYLLETSDFPFGRNRRRRSFSETFGSTETTIHSSLKIIRFKDTITLSLRRHSRLHCSHNSTSFSPTLDQTPPFILLSSQSPNLNYLPPNLLLVVSSRFLSSRSITLPLPTPDNPRSLFNKSDPFRNFHRHLPRRNQVDRIVPTRSSESVRLVGEFESWCERIRGTLEPRHRFEEMG